MEAVVLVMEAFQGHEGRIQYDIVGHSGESHDITFVDHKNPPTDNKQRLDIIKVCQPVHCFMYANPGTNLGCVKCIDLIMFFGANSMEHRPSWNADSCSANQQNVPHFMEHKN
jgi:hypothetical protein